MNNISIEKLDLILERVPNVTYQKAKEALEYSNGDVVEAIIYLETINTSNDGFKYKKINDEKISIDIEDIKHQLKDIIKKSSVIRVIVDKNDKTIMNIPLTVGVVGLALGPLVTLAGLSVAVIGKCNIKVENEEDGSIVDLGELSEEKINVIKEMLSSTSKDVKEAFDNNYKTNKDSKDITDELIIEDNMDEYK